MLITELINDKKLSPQQFPNVYRFGSMNEFDGSKAIYIIVASTSRSLYLDGHLIMSPAMLIIKNRYAKQQGGQYEINTTMPAGTYPDH